MSKKQSTIKMSLDPTYNEISASDLVVHSHDKNSYQLNFEFSDGCDNPLPLKDAKPRILFVLDNDIMQLYQLKIDSENLGEASFTFVEPLLSYEGIASAYVYVDYENKKHDVGGFKLKFKKSAIDGEMPEIEGYIEDIDKALKKVDELEVKINENDLVRQPELKEVEKIKADKSDLKALEKEIENAQSGFLGDFNSESELKAKYPNGEKGFANVFGADGIGYRYTWKDGNWIKGGLANGMAIADRSIDSDKISKNTIKQSNTSYLKEYDLEKQNNLVDLNNILTGHYSPEANGNFIKSATHHSTEILEIPKCKKLVSNISNTYWTFFDANKKYMSLGNITSLSTDVPDGAKYFSKTIQVSFLNKAIIVTDTTNTPAYTKFKYTDDSFVATEFQDGTIGKNKLKENSVTKLNVSFQKPLEETKQVNLFDKNNYFDFGYFDLKTGFKTFSNSYSTSRFIPVKKGQILSAWSDSKLSRNVNWIFFDVNKEFVKGILGRNVVVDADGYVSVTFPNDAISTFMIIRGLEPVDYTPFLYEDDSLIVKNKNDDLDRLTIDKTLEALQRDNMININDNINHVKNFNGNEREEVTYANIAISIPFKKTDKNFKSVVLDGVNFAQDGKIFVGVTDSKNLKGKKFDNTSFYIVSDSKNVLKNIQYEKMIFDIDMSTLIEGDYQLVITFIPTNLESSYQGKIMNYNAPKNISQIIKDGNTFYLNEDDLDIFWVGNWGPRNWEKLTEKYFEDWRFFPLVYFYEENPTIVNFKNNENTKDVKSYIDFEIPIIKNDVTELFISNFTSLKDSRNYDFFSKQCNGVITNAVKITDRKITLDAKENVKTEKINVDIINDFQETLKGFELDIKLYNPTNPTNKKNVLIIGDSLTERNQGRTTGTLAEKLSENGFNNFNLIGTKESYVKGAFHEGRSGWKTTDYTNVSKSDNPFSINGKIDFKQYCINNDFTGIDICIVHLNWNTYSNEDLTQIVNNMEKLANYVSESYPDAKIFIVGLSMYSKGKYAGWNTGTKKQAWEYDKAYVEMCKNKVNWEVIHLLPYIDHDYGSHILEVDANLRTNKKEKVMGDHVHGGDVEYDQIADVYYRYILSTKD